MLQLVKLSMTRLVNFFFLVFSSFIYNKLYYKDDTCYIYIYIYNDFVGNIDIYFMIHYKKKLMKKFMVLTSSIM